MGVMQRLVQGLVVVGVSLCGAVWAQELPRLVQQEGRATLMVDGKPYIVLGAQVDNSSGWPERLKQVWPAAERMRLNTLEVPVYWEQMEPERGRFDFSVVDDVLAQAREHKVRLVLLWFGTWKNGKMHYVPEWVKQDTKTYPRMMTKAGAAIDVLSPNAPANLEADQRGVYCADEAFARGGCAAHGVDDAGGERVGIAGERAGFWAGGAEGV